jgi:hypothetical protein
MLVITSSKKKYPLTWYYSTSDIHFGTYSFIFHYDVAVFRTPYMAVVPIHILINGKCSIIRGGMVLSNHPHPYL